MWPSVRDAYRAAASWCPSSDPASALFERWCGAAGSDVHDGELAIGFCFAASNPIVSVVHVSSRARVPYAHDLHREVLVNRVSFGISPRRSRCGLGAALIALLVGGCVDQPTFDGPPLTVTVAPLALSHITDASYHLSVENAAEELVWERTITSSAYGDGTGGLSYVGTCDASDPPNTNTVTVTLLSLSDADGPLASGDWAVPPPASQDVVCRADGDTRVDFDLTVARAAEQGFFDVAVELDDLFCSAKLDCGPTIDPADDLLLLHDDDGVRRTTAVLGLACTPTPNGSPDTRLYLDDLTITCVPGDDAVVAVGAPGNVDLTEPPSSDPGGYLFAAAVYRGEEEIANKVYWNVALGLNRGAFTTAGACTLSATGTASDGPFAGDSPMTSPDGVWPHIVWSVPLSDADGRLCTEHALFEPGSGVYVDYTVGPHRFSSGYSTEDGPLSGLPPLTLDAPAGQVDLAETLSGTLTLVLRDTDDAIVAAPAGAGVVTFSSSDPGCVAAPAPAALTEGETSVSVSLSYGGATSTPCTAIITASHAAFGDSTVTATVYPPPDLGPLTLYVFDTSGRIGGGLTTRYELRLPTGAHGGQTVTVTSSDPSAVVLSATATGAASGTLALSVPPGDYNAYFWAHGVPGGPNVTVTLTATSLRFEPDTASLSHVTPVLEVWSVTPYISRVSTQTVPDDPFFAVIGVPDPSSAFGFRNQEVSPAFGPVPVTFTVSGVDVDTLVTSGVTGSAVTVDIAAGQDRTPTTVAQGGAALRFVSPAVSGVHTVTATAPGVDPSWPGATASGEVGVATAYVRLNGSETVIGAGLQQDYSVTIYPPAATTLTSTRPDRVLISTSATTAGAPVLHLNNNDDIWVQVLGGEPFDFELIGDSDDHASFQAPMSVVAPVVNLSGVLTSRSGNPYSDLSDDLITVEVGLRSGSSIIRQPVAAAEAPLEIDVTMDATPAATLVSAAGTGSPAVATFGADWDGVYSIAQGSVLIRPASPLPVGNHTFTLRASAPWFDDTFPGSARTVTYSVSPLTTTLEALESTTVGAGMRVRYRVLLSTSGHGDLTFRVASQVPATMKVSPQSDVAAPTNYADFALSDNATSFFFYTNGVVGRSGTAPFTVQCVSAGCMFPSTSGAANVVTGKLVLEGLVSPHNGTYNDAFLVRIGVPAGAGTDWQQAQAPSGYAVTVTTSNPAVGRLSATSTSTLYNSLVTTIDVGDEYGSNIYFRPQGNGSTTITAVGPGGVAVTSQTVTVTGL